jgi:hypothetical protein
LFDPFSPHFAGGTTLCWFCQIIAQIQQDSATSEKSINHLISKDFIGHLPQKRRFFPFSPLQGVKMSKKRPTT